MINFVFESIIEGHGPPLRLGVGGWVGFLVCIQDYVILHQPIVKKVAEDVAKEATAKATGHLLT